MTAFNTTYINNQKMIVRVGTGWVYPYNDDTADAACQMEWAITKLAEPCALFPNGRTSHECANEVIEKGEDVLLQHAHYMATA